MDIFIMYSGNLILLVFVQLWTNINTCVFKMRHIFLKRWNIWIFKSTTKVLYLMTLKQNLSTLICWNMNKQKEHFKNHFANEICPAKWQNMLFGHHITVSITYFWKLKCQNSQVIAFDGISWKMEHYLW